jgi:hypothetical protein
VRDYDEAPTGSQLAFRLGPERIAFVLSVIVVIAVALLIGSRDGTTPTRPGSSSPSPAPQETVAAPALRSGPYVTLRNATGSAASSVARGPASTQA